MMLVKFLLKDEEEIVYSHNLKSIERNNNIITGKTENIKDCAIFTRTDYTNEYTSIIMFGFHYPESAEKPKKVYYCTECDIEIDKKGICEQCKAEPDEEDEETKTEYEDDDEEEVIGVLE